MHTAIIIVAISWPPLLISHLPRLLRLHLFTAWLFLCGLGLLKQSKFSMSRQIWLLPCSIKIVYFYLCSMHNFTKILFFSKHMLVQTRWVGFCYTVHFGYHVSPSMNCSIWYCITIPWSGNGYLWLVIANITANSCKNICTSQSWYRFCIHCVYIFLYLCTQCVDKL